MEVRRYLEKDKTELIELVAHFRTHLSSLKGILRKPDMEQALEEISEYLGKKYPIYVAEDTDRNDLLGYIVCRVDDTVVWAESLYVKPTARNRGVGNALYDKAEELCQGLGGDTLYNWIHPNNHTIVGFLKKRGYDVLNLVEVRKTRQGEEIEGNMQVGEHQFLY